MNNINDFYDLIINCKCLSCNSCQRNSFNKSFILDDKLYKCCDNFSIDVYRFPNDNSIKSVYVNVNINAYLLTINTSQHLIFNIYLQKFDTSQNKYISYIKLKEFPMNFFNNSLTLPQVIDYCDTLFIFS